MQITPHQGAERKECGCKSWLDHWRKNTGQVMTVCRVQGCESMDIKGAQVKIVNINVVGDCGIYIVPLCKKHSMADTVLELIPGTKPVPVDKSTACEKPMSIREFIKIQRGD